ncbi:UNVERIFIED_CONTAM: hypothetical protein RMT77_012267 [Armadillidium vulgare]
MKFFAALCLLMFVSMVLSNVEKHNKPCPTPHIIQPVCGSDGVTYNNKWVLQCEKDKKPDLQLVHDGECQKEIENKT